MKSSDHGSPRSRPCLRKRIIIPVIVLAVLIVTYISLLVSVSSVVNTVRSIYCGEISAAPDSPLKMYDISKRYPAMVYADMRITRLFVIHNGRHGFMYVLYSCEYMDANNKILNASGDILSKWEIEKKDGEWVIVSIEEAP